MELGDAWRRIQITNGSVTSDETNNADLYGSVDELFEEIAVLIDRAVQDPGNNCQGKHVGVIFGNGEYGVPEYWDSFSDCEDGIGPSATITATN